MAFDGDQRFNRCSRRAPGGEEGEVAVGDAPPDQQAARPQTIICAAELLALEIGQFEIAPIMQPRSFGSGSCRQALPVGRAPRHECHRALPDGSTGRPCRALCRLWAGPHRLQLVPQPALSQVPGPGSRRVAGTAASRAVADAILPRRVHPAGCGRRHRLPEQGDCLCHPVPGGRRDVVHDRQRPTSPRRRDRPGRGSAYVGPEPAASPPRPLHRARSPTAGSSASNRDRSASVGATIDITARPR